MTLPPDTPPEGDGLHRMVTGFRNPFDAWLSQAKIHAGEAHTWGIFLARHARRKSRNEHRVLIAKLTALATRSEEGWGSHEAADVARGQQPNPTNIMDKLLGASAPPAPPKPTAPAPRDNTTQGGS